MKFWKKKNYLMVESSSVFVRQCDAIFIIPFYNRRRISINEFYVISYFPSWWLFGIYKDTTFIFYKQLTSCMPNTYFICKLLYTKLWCEVSQYHFSQSCNLYENAFCIQCQTALHNQWFVMTFMRTLVLQSGHRFRFIQLIVARATHSCGHFY